MVEPKPVRQRTQAAESRTGGFRLVDQAADCHEPANLERRQLRQGRQRGRQVGRVEAGLGGVAIDVDLQVDRQGSALAALLGQRGEPRPRRPGLALVVRLDGHRHLLQGGA